MKRIYQQIDEYIEYCKGVRGMSPVTVLNKRCILEKFVQTTGIKSLKQLTNNLFNNWVVATIKSGVGVNSVNTYSATIFAMVKYHSESGVKIPLKVGMIKKQRGQKVGRKFYSSDEVEEVIRLADCETGLMIRMMFETGMRIAELTRLRVSDLEGQRVRFIGKGRKRREVYLSEMTYELLQEYRRESGVRDFLWGVSSLNGWPPTVNTVRNKMKRAFFAAGHEGFYPHALRHSFATNLQMRGASMAEIKEMMGHESVATTEGYLHGFEGRLSELFLKYQ